MLADANREYGKENKQTADAFYDYEYNEAELGLVK